MRCVTYKCVLIFIIIKCVKSQDNNPDQPADEEDEEDNFEVLDLDKIIQQRLDRFEDPQYLPQYQQLQESQYPTQPQIQPQQYDLDQSYDQHQPELLGYQPQQYPGYQTESFQYQPETSGYHPQQYAPYQSYELQTQTQQQQYYQPPPTQPTPQVPQLTQESQYQYYGTETQDPYVYQQPYGTQTLCDIGHQPITETQPQIQPAYQHYIPVTQPSIPLTQPSYPYYQHYVLTPTFQQTQAGYQLYEPTQTQSIQESQPQPQPQFQQLSHYVPELVETQQPTGPLEPEVIQVQQIDDEETEKERQQTAQSLDKIKSKMDYDQQTQEPRKKRKKSRSPSPVPSDEPSESGDEEEEPVKRKEPKPRRKYNLIKFYKRSYSGNILEMTNEDYLIIVSDGNKKIYKFRADLEQLECGGEIVYEHTSGTPYCLLLSHSLRTDIFILTSSDGFTLVKKTKGEWRRTDAPIPDHIKLFTQNKEGDYVLMTNKDYNIDFTSMGSFRYEFFHVTDTVAWEKTDDDGYPLEIYVTPKMRVIVNFEGYSKVLGIKNDKYILYFRRKFSGRSKYS
ncbi:SVSP family protein [Theileria parva strain Muguga]|uniref:Theileria-specific sub-telomeric protein, SVSP family n=1 Tax=Theileria parva TaxID=5875 RepID=Q4N3M6_THEPA|nr:SVSP family protein [Theileria parva strain Muguga]EAN32282.1 SVSP family protein [Theileria parva strain Muguga]|eukprot:XP_764565.1 hypothetical protein [Theileria parva strain Muguga]